MIVIQILFDTVFSLALIEVKRRLICNALCKLFFYWKGIGHFRVAVCLGFKASLGAQLL